MLPLRMILIFDNGNSWSIVIGKSSSLCRQLDEQNPPVRQHCLTCPRFVNQLHISFETPFEDLLLLRSSIKLEFLYQKNRRFVYCPI